MFEVSVSSQFLNQINTFMASSSPEVGSTYLSLFYFRFLFYVSFFSPFFFALDCLNFPPRSLSFIRSIVSQTIISIIICDLAFNQNHKAVLCYFVDSISFKFNFLLYRLKDACSILCIIYIQFSKFLPECAYWGKPMFIGEEGHPVKDSTCICFIMLIKYFNGWL